EFLAFVRIDISSAEAKAFAEHYASVKSADGLAVAPMVPLMLWLFADQRPGFVVAEAIKRGPAREAGIERHDIVLADIGPDGDPAASIARRLAAGEAVEVRRKPRYQVVKLR